MSGAAAVARQPGDPDGEPPPPQGWQRLIAPFRSEDAAFRVLLWTVAVALVVIAVAVLVRAVG